LTGGPVFERYIAVMRIGLRVGPAWISTGGSRRRRRSVSAPKTIAILVPLIAIGDALAEGGWWAVLGWTAVAVTLIVLVVRALHHPGAAHAGIDRHEPLAAPRPVNERLAYSNRR
jgi:hypothetical protein